MERVSLRREYMVPGVRADKPLVYERGGYVYIAEMWPGAYEDLVKIGFTFNPGARLRCLRTQTACAVRLVKLFDRANLRHERTIQAAFAGARVVGEYFRWSTIRERVEAMTEIENAKRLRHFGPLRARAIEPPSRDWLTNVRKYACRPYEVGIPYGETMAWGRVNGSRGQLPLFAGGEK